MIEFLQPLVDAVSRVLPAFTDRRRRDAVAELGTELFLIYVQLNEALVAAEEIVSSLEAYVSRMQEHVQSGQDRYALNGGSWVSDRVRAQLENLQGIRATMNRWRRELQVLDGQSINQLHFLLNEKFGALGALAGAIYHQRLPLGIGDVILIDDQGVLRPRHDIVARYEELDRNLAMNSVDMNQPWGPEVLAVVERYLTLQRPRERMADIRSSLERIREALESNFSLTDVLMRVGDPRLRQRRGWNF